MSWLGPACLGPLFYDLIRKGKFPSQVNLGPRAVGWVENEIVEWIEARIDESRAREYPTSLQNP